jgi:hypothetical protein
MTLRQTIKRILFLAATKSNPTTFAAFKQMALGTLDCIERDDLQSELDRIELIRSGLPRLFTEVWNEFECSRKEDESIKAWLSR